MELIEIRSVGHVSEDIVVKDCLAVFKYCVRKPLEMQTLAQEHLYCFCLNGKNKIITAELISKGSLTSSVAHPREIFKAAILVNAVSIILAHNHPSGDINPSMDDISVTKRIEKSGVLLGIRLVDHIIIGGDNKWFSFLQKRMINNTDRDRW